MSKPISELFSSQDGRANLHSNVGEPRNTENGTGSWVTTVQQDGNSNSYSQYLQNNTKQNILPSENSYDNIASTGDAVRLPASVLPESTGGQSTNIANVLENLQADVPFLNHPYISTMLSVVNRFPENTRIPLHKSQELYSTSNLGNTVNKTAALIKSGISNLIGMTPVNYDAMIIAGMTSKITDLLSSDAASKLFEQGRMPADISKFVYDQVSSIYSKSYSSIVDNISSKANNSDEMVLDRIEINSKNRYKYNHVNDPYKNTSTDPTTGDVNLNNIITGLDKRGYLMGYKKIAGFEMGTNHNWMIKLRPYESLPLKYQLTGDDVEESSSEQSGTTDDSVGNLTPAKSDSTSSDGDAYDELSDSVTKSRKGQVRKTCVPPLPKYALPNLWDESTEVTSVKNKVYTDVASYLTNRFDVGKDGYDLLVNSLIEHNDSRSNVRWFSYSENTPVISYDLNYGTIRTDSIRLFNGSSMEVFAGMQFNATMNMSILDDVNHSMYKYMIEYINAIYDVNSHSMAPFYDMAFEIELTIFRAGNQIDQKHKFIAIPIEFTPRLEGASDPDESRVDITFGIIGYVRPVSIGSQVFQEKDLLRGRTKNASDNSVESGEVKTELKWNDVILHMGSNNDSELKYSKNKN